MKKRTRKIKKIRKKKNVGQSLKVAKLPVGDRRSQPCSHVRAAEENFGGNKKITLHELLHNIEKYRKYKNIRVFHEPENTNIIEGTWEQTGKAKGESIQHSFFHSLYRSLNTTLKRKPTLSVVPETTYETNNRLQFKRNTIEVTDKNIGNTEKISNYINDKDGKKKETIFSTKLYEVMLRIPEIRDRISKVKIKDVVIGIGISLHENQEKMLQEEIRDNVFVILS